MKRRVLKRVLLLGVAVLPALGDEAAFIGTIVYEQSATGGEAAKAFTGLAAKRITVHLGESGYRQDEEGGLNEGSVIARAGSKVVLRLDHGKKTSERGSGMKLDDLDAETKKFMAGHFETPLKDTGVTEKIAGYDTRKFKVGKSPFVRPGAVAHVWVAEGLDLGRHRYNFDFEFHRMTAPVPQSIPVAKGSILKAVIEENGAVVTMKVVSVEREKPADDLFRKPEGYEGPDFPAEAKEVAAPVGPVVDVSGLESTIRNGIGTTFVLVKPGTFTMGSPEGVEERGEDERQHEVTLTRPYYLATTEVTQKQWKEVMGADPPSAFQGDDLPVEKVTWDEAVEFCRKLSEKDGKSYRLPTEAEWEYAARAGEESMVLSLRERREWLKGREWTYSTAKYKTHPVGTLKGNAWGLHDMLGNVSEWTRSGMGDYPEGKATDPQGTDSENKVVRGGDWVAVEHNARFGQRSPHPVDKRKSTIGFRVLCEAK